VCTPTEKRLAGFQEIACHSATQVPPFAATHNHDERDQRTIDMVSHSMSVCYHHNAF
jgi:hypothetical protein